MAQLTVSELSEETGVKVPTIHAYLRRGLLPAPTRVSATRFLYDRRHVNALRLIRLLRERRHLSLDRIEQVLPGLIDGDDEDAFRPQMWEEVLSAQLESGPEQRLVDTARKLFAERGYGRVGIEDICHQAGMAKGSFYRYFSSKDDVYLAAAASIAETVGKAMREGPPCRSEADAAGRLAELAAPMAPLLLEVTARALHGEPGHAGVVPGVVQRLTEETAQCLPGRRRSAQAAGRAVTTALSRVLGPSLGLEL